MLAAFLITLRETLEAALIVGIILAYLKKTKNEGHGKFVWGGVVGGLIVSVVLALVFNFWFGGFEGQAEELYEGIVMLLAAGLLSWMILWMLTQRRDMKANIEGKVAGHIEDEHPWGLFTLALVGVAREGIETVIFLEATLVGSGFDSVFGGALVGIVVALLGSYALFKGLARVPLRKFFTFSSVLLILFAAGLFAHGIHELQEAGIVPVLMEHVWDMNGILDENGIVGSMMKALFGYNGNPNLLEVIFYGVYIVFSGVMWKRLSKA